MQECNSVLRRRRLPMVDQEEVRDLGRLFGEPLHRVFDVKAGGSILEYRWRKDSDRRAEMVFAVQGPGEQLWLHTKHQYEQPIFRLPTGGIEWDETVYAALQREVAEEIGLEMDIQRFVALIEYRFHRHDSVARFASYLFLLRNVHGRLVAVDNEEVAEFRSVLPRQLPQVAADLRNIIGIRREWGHWRAIAHDILYEVLIGGS